MAAAKRIVLVGGGHAHVHVVSSAARFSDAGIEVVLIDPGKLWYSGMATGMLSGDYTPEEDTIDLGALCERRGAVFKKGEVVGVDPAARTVTLSGGETVGYDVLSVNVGSECDPKGIEDPDGVAWRVKPIRGLPEFKASVLGAGREPVRVGVIGGGPTGCEIAANLQALLRKRQISTRVTILHGGDRLIGDAPSGASRRLAGYLAELGTEVVTGVRVRRVGRNGRAAEVVLEDGEVRQFDEVMLATGLAPSSVVGRLGLGEAGLDVDASLRSREHSNIFGAGDCINFRGEALPKLGVFGVRQAPVLERNLLRAVAGEALEAYVPQKKYLSILNLGGGRGLAMRGEFYWMGRLAYMLKHFIDKRFMGKYQD